GGSPGPIRDRPEVSPWGRLSSIDCRRAPWETGAQFQLRAGKVKPETVTSATAPQPLRIRAAVPIIVAGTVLLAFSPILVRLSEVGPIATGVNRMLLPLPVFFAWMYLQPAQRFPLSAPGGLRGLRIALISGAFFAGDLMCWHWSIKLTSVANATVLANLAPVFVVLGAWVVFREKVNRVFVIGLAIAVSGVAVLMSESLTISAATLLGDTLGLVTSWFYAGYILSVSRARRAMPTVATMAWGGAMASLILYVIAFAWEGNVWPDTARGWMVAFALAGITQILGQTLIALALAHVPAEFGAMILLVQPAIAAVLAWALFGEVLSGLQAMGGVAILAGLYISRRSTS
ncbi:MAG: DMT family transporter, partial [Rhodobacteraceae bacterium]|nr:DMT family transporter [Paracoccaceae bacterium]